MDNSPITEEQLDIFNEPSRIIIAGFSNGGKSYLCTKLVQKYHLKFSSIIICGGSYRALLDDPVINKKIIAQPEIINPLDEHVKEYLKSSKAYTLHALKPRKFQRRKVLSPKPRIYLACDLAEMGLLAKYNDDIKYILVCVDIFSRYAQVAPLKRKDGQTVSKALKNILESSYFQGIRKINTDRGGEFYNSHMQRMLAAKNIKLYSEFSQETKAAIAERFIRTMKTKIYKYMTAHNTSRYLPILPDIIKAYNTTPHRGLGGLTPVDVHALSRPQDIKKQFNLMYKSKDKPKAGLSSLLAVGDTVRITLSNRISTFKKGFARQNTEEIFRIIRIDKSQPIPLYFLQDLNNKPIDGGFYKEELTLTHLPVAFNIEKVLRKRTLPNNKLQYKVRYEGYDSSFDQWIDADDLLKI
ncbi:uncharacterized protein [Procambarus clarkii]|uniref:uncharacterized protein n=1 Tax=Procambarus clarkii TaxID=6728 RepID=UPI0037421432